MAETESYRERQELELGAIKSIFCDDAQDLREGENNTNWRPLNITISLVPPQEPSSNNEVYARAKLHVICSAKYPKIPPKISLENTEGLSNSQIEELLDKLNDRALNSNDEVIIFDLTQIVQAFLLEHNKPPVGSFYDVMILEKSEQKEKRQKIEKELREAAIKHQEIIKNEARNRREKRSSMSESSPSHRAHTNSTDVTDGVQESYNEQGICEIHLNSEDLYFSTVNRKIRRGSCLGHSSNGCIIYSGMDTNTGQLIYLTEWTIKYSQFESKCPINCKYSSTKCNGHSIDEIIQSIERELKKISHLRHKNLIAYECMMYSKKKDGVIIYLAQEFVLGSSLSTTSNSIGWSLTGVSTVASGVLNALIFLHNKGVSHRNLDATTVFVDNKGVCRVSDYFIVPYINSLIDIEETVTGDLPALGYLIESLLPSQNQDMSDFIEKCKSETTLSASDLLKHSFLMPIPSALVVTPQKVYVPEKKVKEIPILASGYSRIEKEFEYLQSLGRGAYGDVLKLKNKLDNRQYAIKRIPVISRNQEIHKKMTREVKLLSGLNHENVVRYYNSWIENATKKDYEKHEAINGSQSMSLSIPSEIASNMANSSTNDWSDISLADDDDSSSGGIVFTRSDDEDTVAEDIKENEESALEKIDQRETIRSPRLEYQFIYIQMEFCEKSTLGTAIGNELYKDRKRIWRLFRELVEGLSYLHWQGMIHRDLKPANIFLDSNDQVKIGDFGLATTSLLALQPNQEVLGKSNSHNDNGDVHTGEVGTALYVAPELLGKASKAIYNQKVDLYSLGIILFEMYCLPFKTVMERHAIINLIRNSEGRQIPEYMEDGSYSELLNIIRWLLLTEPSGRPTADELLISDLLPPLPMEATHAQDTLKQILANPQSKIYKHLVARCLAQECNTVLELNYHCGLIQINPRMELVKSKITALFQKHGGVEMVTPLLTPYIKTEKNTIVRLMTHSGSVVCLPHDLRTPFIKHAALSGTTATRRYSIGRVYREIKAVNFHPKQLYECAFDIVTASTDGKSRFIDAELFFLASEIINEFPAINARSIRFCVNHTSLLKAIFMSNNVPPEKYSEVFAALFEFINKKISKTQLNASITALMDKYKHNSTNLIEMLLTEILVGQSIRIQLNASSLGKLLKGSNEISLLANEAIAELESVVSLARTLGVNYPIHFYAGLYIGYERAQSGGIIWQMLSEAKTGRQKHSYVLAVGGRYDSMISNFQKEALDNGNEMCQNRCVRGAGFSFSLDRMLSAFKLFSIDGGPSTDVVVCSNASQSTLNEVAQILRSLWTAGIQCAVVESHNLEEAQEMAKELGAIHCVIVSEYRTLRLRSFIKDRFEDKLYNREELFSYLKRVLKPETDSPSSTNPSNTSSNYNESSYKSNKSAITPAPTLPHMAISFLPNQKMSSAVRRRQESLVSDNISSVLGLFNKTEKIEVIIVDLPLKVIHDISLAVDPRARNLKDINSDIGTVINRYPANKRLIKDIQKKINEINLEEEKHPAVCLYAQQDNSYRFIL